MSGNSEVELTGNNEKTNRKPSLCPVKSLPLYFNRSNYINNTHSILKSVTSYSFINTYNNTKPCTLKSK